MMYLAYGPVGRYEDGHGIVSARHSSAGSQRLRRGREKPRADLC